MAPKDPEEVEQFEVSGEWWLPESPQNRVVGSLSYGPLEGARLRLFGRLARVEDFAERTTTDGVTTMAVTEEAVIQSGSHRMVLGEGDNRGFTLIDCLRTESRNLLFGGPPSELLDVAQVLKGAHFAPGEAIAANGVSFGLENLAGWIGESGISLSVLRHSNPQDVSQPSYQIEGRLIPNRRTTTASGAVVLLQHRVGTAGDFNRYQSLTERFNWRLELPSVEPIDVVIDLASDLQDLVSLGIGAPAAWSSLSLWHPDVVDEWDGQRRPHPIEMFARWALAPSGRVSRHDMAFTFKDQGGMAGVARWMDVAAIHRKALGRVMSTRYHDGGFVTDRLLNCTAALEAFDRQANPRSTFADRLDRCVELAGPPFQEFVGSAAEWAQTVKYVRDDVAHHLGRRQGGSTGDIHYLWESLFLLFSLCMLREAGHGDPLLEAICETRRHRWLKPLVQSAVKSLRPDA